MRADTHRETVVLTNDSDFRLVICHFLPQEPQRTESCAREVCLDGVGLNSKPFIAH